MPLFALRIMPNNATSGELYRIMPLAENYADMPGVTSTFRPGILGVMAGSGHTRRAAVKPGILVCLA